MMELMKKDILYKIKIGETVLMGRVVSENDEFFELETGRKAIANIKKKDCSLIMPTTKMFRYFDGSD